MLKQVFLIFILLLIVRSNAQFTVGIKFGGIAFHQQKIEPNYYRLSVDKKGHWVGYLGCSFTFAYQFNPFIGIKLIQTILPYDCAGRFSGITHLGIDLHDRIVGMKSNTHRLSASFGPLIYYRKNWKTVSNYYEDVGFLKSNKSEIWERKFVWHGGQVQYDYFINPKTSISTNFLPGFPYIYTFMTGVQTVL